MHGRQAAGRQERLEEFFMVYRLGRSSDNKLFLLNYLPSIDDIVVKRRRRLKAALFS